MVSFVLWVRKSKMPLHTLQLETIAVQSISNCFWKHFRNCSSGEGIFTFYSPRAREIVNALEAATRTAQRQPLSAVEGKKAGKMNPLLAFLRRGSTPTSPSLTRLKSYKNVFYKCNFLNEIVYYHYFFPNLKVTFWLQLCVDQLM